MRRALLLSCLLTLSPARAAEPDPAAFLARIDELRREAEIPGLAVAVVVDGEIQLAAGLGVSDLDRGTPVTAETPFDIASVSKPLSAVAILKLVEQGKLDLDRPIADYSEWAEFCRDFGQTPSIFARDLRCDPAVHSLRHLLSHTVTGTPGEHFSYNPVIYSWASRPVMAAAGEPFSTLVTRLVLEPAGMTRSARRHRGLPLPAELARDLASPHGRNAEGQMARSAGPPPQGDGAAGGVISTVLDLARFDLALDRGRLISPASRERMMAPALTRQGEPLAYGLGWFVQRHQGRRLVWHSGLWEGAGSALYLKLPDEGRTLILLANSDGIWWHNALDRAEVEKSPFARAFLEAWPAPR